MSTVPTQTDLRAIFEEEQRRIFEEERAAMSGGDLRAIFEDEQRRIFEEERAALASHDPLGPVVPTDWEQRARMDRIKEELLAARRPPRPAPGSLGPPAGMEIREESPRSFGQNVAAGFRQTLARSLPPGVAHDLGLGGWQERAETLERPAGGVGGFIGSVGGMLAGAPAAPFNIRAPEDALALLGGGAATKVVAPIVSRIAAVAGPRVAQLAAHQLTAAAAAGSYGAIQAAGSIPLDVWAANPLVALWATSRAGATAAAAGATAGTVTGAVPATRGAIRDARARTRREGTQAAIDVEAAYRTARRQPAPERPADPFQPRTGEVPDIQTPLVREAEARTPIDLGGGVGFLPPILHKNQVSRWNLVSPDRPLTFEAARRYANLARRRDPDSRVALVENPDGSFSAYQEPRLASQREAPPLPPTPEEPSPAAILRARAGAAPASSSQMPLRPARPAQETPRGQEAQAPQTPQAQADVPPVQRPSGQPAPQPGSADIPAPPQRGGGETPGGTPPPSGNVAAGSRRFGRPDLANPGETPGARGIVDVVDEARNIAGEPKPRPRSVLRDAAEERLKANFDAEVGRIVRKAKDGKAFDELDTHVGMKAINRLATQAIEKGDNQAYARTVEVALAYRQGRGETARALGAGVDPVMTPAERNRTLVVEMLTEPTPAVRKAVEKLDAEIAKAPEPKKAKITARRQKLIEREAEKLRKITDAVKQAGLDPTLLNDDRIADPATFAHIARIVSAARSSAGSKVQEYWRNSILSAVTTHARNLFSNLVYGPYEKVLKLPVSATTNLAVRDVHSPQFGDAIAYSRALWPAMTRAARNMVKAWRHELPILEAEIAKARGQGMGAALGASKLDLPKPGVAIGGRHGRFIRIPQRSLIASDEFTKGFWATLEAAAEARRLGKAQGLSGDDLTRFISRQLDDYASPAWERGMVEAQRLTFQAPLGPFGRKVVELSQQMPLLYFVLPFVKTPTNIFKAGLSNTYLNLLKMLYRAGRAGILRYTRGEWTYDRTTLNRDIADTIVGLVALLALHDLAIPGEDGIPIITGSAPSDPGQRDLAYRAAPPQSIRIGDRWFSYAGIEPVATMLATTVDAINAIHQARNGQEYTKAMGYAAASIKRQVRDKTFLKSIGDLIDILESEEGISTKASRVAQSFAVSWVPNLVRSGLSATDPYIREQRIAAEDGLDFVSKVGERIKQQALPTVADPPPPKVDLWGRDIRKDSMGSAASDFLFRLLSPTVTIPTDRATDLDRLILNWNAKHPEETYAPRQPDRRIERELMGEQTDYLMTDDEYHAFLKAAGERALRMLTAQDRKWNVENPSKREIMAIDRALSAARRIERQKVAMKRMAELRGEAKAIKARRAMKSRPTPAESTDAKGSKPGSKTDTKGAKSTAPPQ